ncbi:MAG: DUF3048 domain-containing protein [bacterium]|nr:DUF3048 domain-containing protein [bacterium]
MKQEKIILGVFALILYFLSAVFSYSLAKTNASSVKTVVKSPIPEETKKILKEVPKKITRNISTASRDIQSPLNGEFYTKEEATSWETKRPLAIMIENHLDARPQSGLSSADIVYETVAEGGITRFMAVYYGYPEDVIVGPVRSARTYFLDWVSEYGNKPLYTHVGGANCDSETGSGCANGAPADALGQIERYGWLGKNDLSQFSIGFPTFWRDPDRLGRVVAAEHTMYSSTQKLWKVAQNRGLGAVDDKGKDWKENFIPWKFKDDLLTSDKPQNFSAEFTHWGGYKDYTVRWEYNKEENLYKRFNAGVAHNDLNTNEQLTAKNIVLQFTTERHANDGYDGNAHLLYGTIGSGEAVVLQDGKKIKAVWKKKSRADRTVFFDTLGKEISFNRGQIWIEVMAIGTVVSYE